MSDAGQRPLRVLFVCQQNRLRSATAQRVFEDHPGLEVRSAGVATDAVVPLTRELVEWADLIFVMEKRERNVIHKRYRDLYETRRIVALHIPDEYEFMDDALVALLRRRVTPSLPAG